MGLTQKYREEAQSIADEIYDKYGISCGIGQNASEANGNIDKAYKYIEFVKGKLQLKRNEHSKEEYSKEEYSKDESLFIHEEDAKKELECLRVACNKLHGDIKDATIKFGANNI